MPSNNTKKSQKKQKVPQTGSAHRGATQALENEPSVVTPSKPEIPHEVHANDTQENSMSQLTSIDFGNEGASLSLFSNDHFDQYQTNRFLENPFTYSQESFSTGRGHPQVSQSVSYEHCNSTAKKHQIEETIVQLRKENKTKDMQLQQAQALVEQLQKQNKDLVKSEGRLTKASIKANLTLKKKELEFIKSNVKSVFFKTRKFLPKEWASASNQEISRLRYHEETKLIFKSLSINENVFENGKWVEIVKLIKTAMSEKSKTTKWAIKQRYIGK